MLIGTWNNQNAGAKQWRVTVGSHQISNNSEWTAGSPIPSYTQSILGFKTLKTVLLVKGEGREEILGQCSDILAKCLEPVELTLDHFEHKFFGALKKSSMEETSEGRWNLLTLEWECFEYGETITKQYSGVTEITVHNPGNIITPAVVSIIPGLGAADLTVKGLCLDMVSGRKYDAVIKDLAVEEEIILDGESGLMTKGGVLNAEDIEVWELPALRPGENTITLDRTGMDVTVQFRPRYM